MMSDLFYGIGTLVGEFNEPEIVARDEPIPIPAPISAARDVAWTSEIVADAFADSIINAEAPRMIHIASPAHAVSLEHGPLGRPVWYNRDPYQLLGESQEYRARWGDKVVGQSIQLYENTAGHYRLFTFVEPPKGSKAKGLLFSVNLSVGMREEGLRVLLSQQIVLSQQGPAGVPKEEYARYRTNRRALAASTLAQGGFPVDDGSPQRVYFGWFDPAERRLTDMHDTPMTPSQFLGRFIEVALVMGHFRENKGYEIEWLPEPKRW